MPYGGLAYRGGTLATEAVGATPGRAIASRATNGTSGVTWGVFQGRNVPRHRLHIMRSLCSPLQTRSMVLTKRAAALPVTPRMAATLRHTRRQSECDAREEGGGNHPILRMEPCLHFRRRSCSRPTRQRTLPPPHTGSRDHGGRTRGSSLAEPLRHFLARIPGPLPARLILDRRYQTRAGRRGMMSQDRTS